MYLWNITSQFYDEVLRIRLSTASNRWCNKSHSILLRSSDEKMIPDESGEWQASTGRRAPGGTLHRLARYCA